jgi:TolA-binding protein
MMKKLALLTMFAVSAVAFAQQPAAHTTPQAPKTKQVEVVPDKPLTDLEKANVQILLDKKAILELSAQNTDLKNQLDQSKKQVPLEMQFHDTSVQLTAESEKVKAENHWGSDVTLNEQDGKWYRTVPVDPAPADTK